MVVGERRHDLLLCCFANMCITTGSFTATFYTPTHKHIYRVVQKNEATLHFPKYLENY